MADIVTVSELDRQILVVIRSNVVSLMKHCAAVYGNAPGLLLDVAPQDHEGARPFFPDHITVKTLDINPESGCDFIADICQRNAHIAGGTFDFVVCTEVLEHTLNPFDAVREIRRLLKPGGLLFGSTPFNFRIHGPLPDCWRFTEHGLRALLNDFDVLELNQLETAARALMPMHYTFVAKRPADAQS